MRAGEVCDIAVLGGGDHGRVVIEALRLIHPLWRVVVLDPNGSLHGRDIFGANVVGGDECFDDLTAPGGRVPFVVGIGGILDMSLRRRVYEFAIDRGGLPMRVVHPRAVVSPYAQLDDGVQVLAAAVVNAGAVVGTNTIVNTAAVVEHDCVIGSHAHVATNGSLSGGVTVGDESFVGAGATIRQRLCIGRGSLVGAGAVVVRDVADGERVVGVPARPLVAES